MRLEVYERWNHQQSNDRLKAYREQSWSANLQTNNESQITDNQKKAGKTTVDLGGLFVWCKARTAFPEDDDEVFCGAIEYELMTMSDHDHETTFGIN